MLVCALNYFPQKKFLDVELLDQRGDLELKPLIGTAKMPFETTWVQTNIPVVKPFQGQQVLWPDGTERREVHNCDVQPHWQRPSGLLTLLAPPFSCVTLG